MAKINDTTTYPATTPGTGDHVIGTDVSNTLNDANGEVVTFTLQSIANLKVETDPVVGAVTGIVKADGAGNISAATAGTDYIATETDPVVGAITGIVKADGAGNISAATADTDYLVNIVADTTPQLGGMLDVNGQAIGNGTEELIKFSETVSAVNEITVTNAATGNAPTISATGDDTNIDLVLQPKGTGAVFVGADQVLTDGSGVSLSTKSTPTTSDSFLIFDAAASDAPKTATGAQVMTSYDVATNAVTENAQTGTTYTLVLTDASKLVSMTNAASNVLTIPANATVAFPVGTTIVVLQGGAGATTITATTGVTLNGVSAGSGAVSAQWGAVSLFKSATDTWYAMGSIGTVA